MAANAAQSPDKSPATSFRPQHPPVTYAPESVEMQMRRLADLAFLFQHYDLAYQHYYALKKEFAHTGAWLHQASAAVSSFIGCSTLSISFLYWNFTPRNLPVFVFIYRVHRQRLRILVIIWIWP